MLWLIGGAQIVVGIHKLYPHPVTAWAEHYFFEHTMWGFSTYWDLIFPLFMFIVGVVIPLSLSRRIERGDSLIAIHLQVLKRTALLIVIGFCVLGNLLNFDLAQTRWMGVLQRIGICYCIASILFLHTRWRTQVVMVAGILLGYWALLAWVPVPGHGPGNYSPEGNLSFYLDRLLLPGRKYCNFPATGGDNEGLLATVPYIAIAMLGALAGQWLQTTRTDRCKTLGLVAAGLVSLALGFAWGRVFPIIEILSTSSFVLVAVGWSLLLLAVFYWVIDVKGYHAWAFFFIVIGMNAILIYTVGGRIVNFGYTADFFVHGLAKLAGPGDKLVFACTVLTLKWLLLYYLYRQRIFLHC